MGNIFMSSKLRIIFTHAAPYETEYGNNYRYQSHRFTGGTAPGADQYIIKEGTRRSEQLREPDFLCIISPVANGGDADRGQRQQTDQAWPGVYGQDQKKIPKNIYYQTYSSGKSTQKAHLYAENNAA